MRDPLAFMHLPSLDWLRGLWAPTDVLRYPGPIHG